MFKVRVTAKIQDIRDLFHMAIYSKTDSDSKVFTNRAPRRVSCFDRNATLIVHCVSLCNVRQGSFTAGPFCLKYGFNVYSVPQHIVGFPFFCTVFFDNEVMFPKAC